MDLSPNSALVFCQVKSVLFVLKFQFHTHNPFRILFAQKEENYPNIHMNQLNPVKMNTAMWKTIYNQSKLDPNAYRLDLV